MHSKIVEKTETCSGKAAIIIICIIVAILIAGIVGFIIYTQYNESTNENTLEHDMEKIQNLAKINEIQEPVKETEPSLPELEIVEVNMPKQIGKCDVLGQIEIPKIKVKKYILDSESLSPSEVTKFWGDAGIHGAGNFSIIGHNYKGIFHDLKKLEADDTFIITDFEGRQCTYVIYDSYIVEPDDVSCIEDTLDGQREVTLITCTPGGKKRLILKAKEQII